MLLFKYQFDAGFSVFFLLISRIYHVFVGIKILSDAILLCLFLYRTGNCCFLSRPIYSILEYYYFDVVKFYNFPVFRNYFYCLSIPGVFYCQHFSGPSRVSDDLMEIWKDYGGSCSSM